MLPLVDFNSFFSKGFSLPLGVLAAWFFLWGNPKAPAEERPTLAENITSEIHRIFDQNREAIVRVRATDSLGVRLGSGFFVDPAGTVFTHVGIVLNSKDVSVIHNGRTLAAHVLAADERSGIALLKTDCISPFVRLGDSEKVTSNTPVLAIGFPEDHDLCQSFGMVAGRDRHYRGQYFSTSHFRANMAVNRGQAGSPVLNIAGEVIGILVARASDGGSCHVLPIRAAEKIRQDLSRYGDLRPGWVGVEVEDVSEAVHGSTAKIAALSPLTPAAREGLQSGDIVLKIGNVPVSTSEDVLDAAYFLTAGEPAEVKVVRAGKPLTFSIKPMLHPGAAVAPLHAEAPAVP
jgi:serine protease Do